MFNTPNIVGLIKAAAGASDNNSSETLAYQPPPEGPLHDRVFNAMREGDTAKARTLVPHVFEGRGTTSSGRTGRSATTAAAPAAPVRALTTGSTFMPTIEPTIATPEIPSLDLEPLPSLDIDENLDEYGMPISLDSPEVQAESAEVLRRTQPSSIPPSAGAPTQEGFSKMLGGRTPRATMFGPARKSTARLGNELMKGRATRNPAPARTETPASPAPATTPNPHAFRNISAADMRKFRRYTGASNMNSEMDKWKTWQAMQGNRNVSNADFYAARAKGFR